MHCKVLFKDTPAFNDTLPLLEGFIYQSKTTNDRSKPVRLRGNAIQLHWRKRCRGGRSSRAPEWGLIAGTLDALPARAETPDTPDTSSIWSGEYWAKKGDVPLWMFRKRLGPPKAGEPSRPVVFFVHGSSTSSRGFDLHVPGKGNIPS